MRGLRILMYHAIGAPGEPPARFVVPIGAFERQMGWLARLRFNVVRLEDAVRTLLAGERLPPRAVALTFDDGTRDLRTLAFPVLERYGFPATAFIVTGVMGGTVSWTDWEGLAGRPTMTWEDALAVQSLISLEPHTRTHPSLRALSDDEITDEVGGSRADIEARTGRAPKVFAYPYGHFDGRVVGLVSAAGLSAACSARAGVNDAATSPFELRRHEIRGEHTLRRFVLTVVRPPVE
jgi:peptidoglycan/xylan/chitin deacetylase (PgdA/CDA1 family)